MRNDRLPLDKRLDATPELSGGEQGFAEQAGIGKLLSIRFLEDAHDLLFLFQPYCFFGEVSHLYTDEIIPGVRKFYFWGANPHFSYVYI